MFKRIIIWIFILIFPFILNLNLTKAEESTANCRWEDSLCSSSYMIDTWELWLWWGWWINKGWTAKETVDNALGLLVNKLMIAFWVLALFIMTVGWGYMIFAGWQDDLLNKWKSIFTAWIISLVIALSAWIIMKIVISLLY